MYHLSHSVWVPQLYEIYMLWEEKFIYVIPYRAKHNSIEIICCPREYELIVPIKCWAVGPINACVN